MIYINKDYSATDIKSNDSIAEVSEEVWKYYWDKEYGKYWIVENGKFIPIVSSNTIESLQIIQDQIKNLKDLLSQSDYKALKFAEGEISEEEYAPIREQRRAWRAEINELQEQYPKL